MDPMVNGGAQNANSNPAYVSGVDDSAHTQGLSPNGVEIKTISKNADIESKTGSPSNWPVTGNSRNSSEKRIWIRNCFLILTVLITLVVGAVVVVSMYITSSSREQSENKASRKFVFGEMTIKNWVYEPVLQDPKSRKFKNLEYIFCVEINAVYYKSEELSHLYDGCKVIQFRSGSVVVKYRLGLNTESEVAVGKAISVLNDAVRKKDTKAFIGWDIDVHKLNFSVPIPTAQPLVTPSTPQPPTDAQPEVFTQTTDTDDHTTTSAMNITSRPSVPAATTYRSSTWSSESHGTPAPVPSTSTKWSTTMSRSTKSSTLPPSRSTTILPTRTTYSGLNSTVSVTYSTTTTKASACYPQQWACLDGSGCVWNTWLCDREEDCTDGSDEMQNCECTDTEFRCANNKCISSVMKCDNQNQCGDFSDELGCSCLLNQFRCQATPLCVHNDRWCDGNQDCPDGSDEPDNCTCLSSQGRCSSGHCIPGYKMCDKRLDCPDNSDENWCPCGSWEFRCDDGLCLDKSRWCDGRSDCFDESDEKLNCTCLAEQTKCETSSKCVIDYKMCDGFDDCEDGSDERQCNCTVTLFQCNNGKCIDVSKYCDGKSDCADDSDEPKPNCECLPSHYTCNNSRCVSRAVTCDDINDCGDFSDEFPKLSGCNNASCNELQFKCPTGRCLALTKVCDGRLDCPDGADEMQNCVCGSDHFRCPSSSHCIHMSLVCDFRVHCEDGADEMQNCVCPNGTHFQCGNGRCVQGYARCDRDDNCGDNSDELHCGCKSHQFSCGDGRCIEMSWLCDGDRDCVDGEDEDACNICGGGMFSCGDNSTCQPQWARCDGQIHCPDGRDEANCLRLVENNQTMSGVVRTWFQDEWYPICYPDVPVASMWYDRMCKELGHGSMNQAHAVNLPSSVYIKLNTSIRTTYVTGSLVPSSQCNGSRVLSLSCSAKFCGTKSANLPAVEPAAARVTGGEQATEGAWPWQASLLHLIGGHYCGATLINNQWLLTGAHCIDWLPTFLHKYLAVRLGSVKLVLPDAKSVVVKVKASYSHPQFEKPEMINNDIALLQLEAPVKYTDYIRPVCLPRKDGTPPVKRKCYITGWGATQGDRATLSIHLREAKVEQKNDALCAAATSLMTYVYNATTMTCALYESGIINACAGDSGGPMVCQDMTGRWELTGVNSWGHVICNKPTFPSVFAEVAYFRDWIDQVIRDNP